jgi:hypothetical protein
MSYSKLTAPSRAEAFERLRGSVESGQKLGVLVHGGLGDRLLTALAPDHQSAARAWSRAPEVVPMA